MQILLEILYTTQNHICEKYLSVDYEEGKGKGIDRGVMGMVMRRRRRRVLLMQMRKIMMMMMMTMIMMMMMMMMMLSAFFCKMAVCTCAKHCGGYVLFPAAS